MKKIVNIVFITVTGLFTNTVYCQNTKVSITTETRKILYYQVEETVNLNFGGTKTSYTVSDLSLINSEDLGPNNIRTITPVYKKENFTEKNYVRDSKKTIREVTITKKPRTENAIIVESKDIETIDNVEIEKMALSVAIENMKKSEAVEAAITGEKLTYAYINIIDIYVRVAEKGYKSIYVFKIIADSFYFSKNMEKAARWYNELFAMTSNLDSVYYYRYGDALKKTGKNQLGNEMIDKFSQLTE